MDSLAPITLCRYQFVPKTLWVISKKLQHLAYYFVSTHYVRTYKISHHSLAVFQVYVKIITNTQTTIVLRHQRWTPRTSCGPCPCPWHFPSLPTTNTKRASKQAKGLSRPRARTISTDRRVFGGENCNFPPKNMAYLLITRATDATNAAYYVRGIPVTSQSGLLEEPSRRLGSADTSFPGIAKFTGKFEFAHTGRVWNKTSLFCADSLSVAYKTGCNKRTCFY